MAGWNPDLARARSLIRDEGRLRSSYAAAAARRFDIDAYTTLRYRVEDLLETVSAIANDDDFWNRLSAGDQPPTHVQLARIAELDTAAFASLLEAAGYASPPPPPVEELVDDTIASLALAAERFAEVPARARQRQARLDLRTLTWRVRRQIAPMEPAEATPHLLRAAARHLGGTARWLIPAAVAVAAGSIVEAHAPGTGAGIALGKSVERVAEKVSDLASSMLAGGPVGQQAEPDLPEPDYSALPDPLVVHTAALIDQTEAISRSVNPEDAEGEEHLTGLITAAQRHAARVKELLADRGFRDEANVSGALLALKDELERLATGRSLPAAAREEASRLCLGIAQFLTGELAPPREP